MKAHRLLGCPSLFWGLPASGPPSPAGSHNQFCRFCVSLLAPGSEGFRPVGCSPSTAPATASRLLLPSVVHDLRLAPDGSHQAFFG